MKYIYVTAVTFLVVCGLIYWLKPEPALTDSLAVIAALIAFVAVFFTWMRFKESKKEGLVWLLLSIGFFFWLGGESIWLYLEMATKEIPFPSVADYSWLVAYPIFFVALYKEYKRLGVDIGLVKKLGIFLAVLAVALGVVWVLLYPIAVSSEISLFEKFLDLAYPGGDLALFCGALLVTFVYLGGKLGWAWLAISLGFIVYSLADLSFSYLSWIEIYKSGHPMDLLWLIADTIVFVGAAMYRHAYEELV